ncbi:hypothetical protein M9Y10_019890, partial [Tritrichomonas musculus]
MIYEPLKVNNDYEILNEYPFTIRRKSDHFKPSESYDNGYIRVNLNGKTVYKHRLIAEQFIPNDDPEHKTQVDHINHDRSDYHIKNLRWVTSSQNQCNKSSHRGVQYEYFDELPDESTVIDFYETRNGMRYIDEGRYYYYYDDETDEDVFYGKIKDNLYRKLHINVNKNGLRYVSMNDVNNKR